MRLFSHCELDARIVGPCTRFAICYCCIIASLDGISRLPSIDDAGVGGGVGRTTTDEMRKAAFTRLREGQVCCHQGQQEVSHITRNLCPVFGHGCSTTATRRCKLGDL